VALARAKTSDDDPRMEQEPLVYREEVTSMLFVIADMNVHIAMILELLERETGGGEALQEDDS
jgi:hypothetical protein